MFSLEPLPLYIATTFASFHADGIQLLSIQLLISLANEDEIAGAAAFRILVLIPWAPVAFCIGIDLISFSIWELFICGMTSTALLEQM